MKVTKTLILEYLIELKPILFTKKILLVGFFGSFARGEETVYSDIDIAIQKDKHYLTLKSAYDYFDDVEFVKKSLMQKFHRKVDVFDIDSASSMKQSILKDMVYV